MLSVILDMGDDVVPVVHFRPQKPIRARTEERRHGELLKALTIDILNTYSRCSSAFGYSLNYAPRRVLTKNSKGVHNCGHDNAEHDYICRVGDKINNPDGQSYEILERLGHGTFGQVLKCHPSSGSQPVALKIIKNKPAYFHQALVEVRILQMLNQDFDPEDEKRIVRMLDFFVYRKHLCIAFELLSVNLYDVLRQNSFRGVSMTLIRVLTEQLLRAMRCLRDAFVIHCDLKPENVLLMDMQHTRIKLIDFGSACFEKHSVYSYIQSRFYRSPEVLLGLPYTSAIDMWSLGCICAELFLGLPIFPGHSEYNQVCRIVEILGLPPAVMLDRGKSTRRYFRRVEETSPDVAPAGDVPPGSGDNGSECSVDKHQQSHALRRGDETDDEPGPSEIDGMRSPACGQGRSEVPPGAPTEEGHSSPEGEPASRGAAADEDAEVAGESAQGVQPEGAPGAGERGNGGSGAQPREQHLSRSESILDLLKRKFAFSVSVDEHDLPLYESGHSAGSTMSTAGETSEVCASRRRAPSSEELVQRDGSSDGHGEPRASGSSDGGRAQKADESGTVNDTMCSQQARRSHIGRRGVRTFWRLKTREEYERDERKKEPTPKKYFEFKSLEQMLELIPCKKDQSQRALKEEQERRLCFLQFLRGVLQLNPDERWTPKQAAHHTFITGACYDPDFQPPPDVPVPSFTTAPLPGPVGVGPLHAAVEVPRLFAEVMGIFGAYTGGGSARTVQENAVRQRSAGRGMDAEQPRSAPASTRGQGATGSAMVPASRPAASGKSDAEREAEAAVASAGSSGPGVLQGAGLPDAPATQPDSAVPGLWKLPDDNSAESYRPPIDKMPEDFFRSVALIRNMRPGAEQASHETGSPQKARNGAWSVSTGASFCSSASSTGSTPTGGRCRRGVASPHSGGSPLSAGGAPMKGHLSHGALAPESKAAGPTSSRHQLSGPTFTPASSPHGSTASTAIHTSGGGVGGSGAPVQTPHRLAVHAGGVAVNSRAAGSRDGSRGSSPWHMSELSTASDRINSSQPSGSESCGENPVPQYEGAHCNYDECASEDPSQSDHWPRSTQQSDSDCTTPRSHDAGPTRPEEDRSSTKDPQHASWENMIARTGLTRRMDINQSPGSTSAMGNFREAMGMKESGPVIPHGLGARRDAISSMMTLHNSECETGIASAGTVASAPGYGPYSPLPRSSNGAENSHFGVGGTANTHHHHSRHKGRRHQTGTS